MTAISSWKRGDFAVVAKVTITDAGDPVDLTDHTITWQIRKSPNSVSFVAVEADTTDADSGVLLGTISSNVTAAMEPGIWVSDIEISDSEGNPFSSETFEVEVLPDVSRPVPEEP